MKIKRYELAFIILGAFLLYPFMLNRMALAQGGGDSFTTELWTYSSQPGDDFFHAMNRSIHVIGDAIESEEGLEVAMNSILLKDTEMDCPAPPCSPEPEVIWEEPIPSDPRFLKSPLIENVDEDPFSEIVMTCPRQFAIFDRSTALCSYNVNGEEEGELSWKFDLPENAPIIFNDGFLSAADFDRDGINEVAVVATNFFSPIFLPIDEIFVIEQGRLQWRRLLGGTALSHPVIANVDDDPEQEILISSRDFNFFDAISSQVEVFEQDPDLPDAGRLQTSTGGMTGNVVSNPAVGDVNGDGRNDIVFATFASNPIVEFDRIYTVHVFTLVPDDSEDGFFWERQWQVSFEDIEGSSFSGQIVLGKFYADQQGLGIVFHNSANVYYMEGDQEGPLGEVSWDTTQLGMGHLAHDMSLAQLVVDDNPDASLLHIVVGSTQGLSVLNPLDAADPVVFFQDFAGPPGTPPPLVLPSAVIGDLNLDGKQEMVFLRDGGVTGGQRVHDLTALTANFSAGGIDWPTALGHNTRTGLQGYEPPVLPTHFRRGDANVDGNINIADPIAILLHIFRNNITASCLDAADVNDDGVIEVADVRFLLEYIFLASEAPAEPFDMCGADTTPSPLGCQQFSNLSCPAGF